MNELSTTTYEYVIVFTDKSNKFISKFEHDKIIDESTDPEIGGIELRGSYIRFHSIAKILAIDEFYEQYPDEKIKSIPTPRRVEPRPQGRFERVEQLWVKKLASKKDWAMFYSKNTAYCNLNLGGADGVWMGLCTANLVYDGVPKHSPCQSDCYLLSDDELKIMDNYCKANNIHPQPFSELKGL